MHGFLALGLRQSGGLVNTDFIRLFDMDTDHRFDFDDLGWDTQINLSDTFVGVLDMGSFLDEMQSGSVNVQVNDDTGLDWATYTVAVATPRGDTSSTSVVIDGGSTITVDSTVAPVGQLRVGDVGAGTLLVADSGVVDVDGDYSQSVDGTLEIELAGDLLGEFGRINVQDSATLAGTLNIGLDGAFQPSVGDSFEIISATSVAGTFDSVSLPSLSLGLVWNLSYDSNSINLGVLFAADFNGDGTVDGVDLSQWETNLGMQSANHSDGDANGDGRVDSTDFLVWQRQSGLTAPLSAAVQIPEPSAVFLTLNALLIVLPLARVRGC